MVSANSVAGLELWYSTLRVVNPHYLGGGVNERINKSATIGIVNNQMKDLTRWYFLKILMMERTIADKTTR